MCVLRGLSICVAYSSSNHNRAKPSGREWNDFYYTRASNLQPSSIQTIIISKIESDLRYPLLPQLAVVVWLSFQEQTMEEETPTNSKADQAVSRKLSQAEKSRKQKEKDQKQSDFIEKCSIADVLVDAINPKSLKGSSDNTALQSIKGACPNLLGDTQIHIRSVPSLSALCRLNCGGHFPSRLQKIEVYLDEAL
jgi:hypothetical protein